jgi:integrase
MLERDLVAKLGKNKPLASVTIQDVRGLIKAKQLDGQHAMARALLSAVRPFFKWCVAEGLISVSPLATYADPPKAVPRRKRTLTADEIKALWAATEADGVWNRYFRLLLLTAQRREEVAAMDRRELDLSAATWTIPGSRTKNGEDHIVHLSPLALAELARCTAEGSYVFPASRKFASDTPLKKPTISGFSKAKAALDKRLAGVAEWNVHDLRRTAATWMGESGIATSVIERVLNHISGTQGGLIGTYQHQKQLEQRKLAINSWCQYISDLAADRQPENNVISLQRAPAIA